MRIYLAARYSRRLELCGYAAELRDLGFEVRARWLDGSHQISDGGVPLGDTGEALVEGDDQSTSEKSAKLRAQFAQDDLEDVIAADCVISFTEPPRSSASRGGRHVEFGIALATGKTVYVVGYRENLFHWFPMVRFAKNWDEAKRMLVNVNRR